MNCKMCQRFVINNNRQSTIRTWCNYFRSRCDGDDKFCMKYFNMLYCELVQEFICKGENVKGGKFYGAFNNKIQQMLNDPDNEIYKELKKRYNNMEGFLK